MKKSGVGLLLILTVVIAAASVIQGFRFDNQSAGERAASTARDRDLGAVSVAFAELRAAQTAYLVQGQNLPFWMRRVTELSDQIAAELIRLRGSARTSEGMTGLDTTSATFAELMTADKRARSSMSNEQPLVASDLIFGDSLEIRQRFETQLASVRSAEAASGEAELARLSQLRMATSAGGMTAVLLLAIITMLVSNKAQPAASPAATMAQMLRELPPPVKTTTAQSPVSPAATAPTSPLAPVPKPMAPAPTAATVNLPDAAELCVDLARVTDGQDIPGLLKRAGTLLNATGIIIWIADPQGSTLEPMLTHGYSDRVVRRLGTLPATADNVTSLAFRTVRPQSMNASGNGDTGAIAIPLVTSAGCSGVLAAEIPQSRLTPETLALARIVAAQLGTIIAPSESASSAAAEA